MKLLSHSFVGALAVVLGLGTALSAQSSFIQLADGPGEAVTFSGQGAGTSTIGVTLGTCDSAGACTFSGGAAGGHAMVSDGNFTITSSSNSILLSSNGSGGYSVSASAPINFVYNTAIGTPWLTGTLNLLNFTEVAGSSSGEFNSGMEGNLTVTGGYLAKAFTPAGGVLNLDVSFPSNANIASLAGTSLSLTGSETYASEVAATPEPTTLALLCLGLLVLGVTLRKRRRAGSLGSDCVPS